MRETMKAKRELEEERSEQSKSHKKQTEICQQQHHERKQAKVTQRLCGTYKGPKAGRQIKGENSILLRDETRVGAYTNLT